MSNERPNRTQEERAQALEEALKRVRPVVLEHKEPVNKRIEALANRKIDEQQKETQAKEAKKPMSLEEMAKRTNDFDRRAEQAGIDWKKPENGKEKDEQKNEKENDKDKEMTPEKQEQKMKEMFSKVKLPSGMEIHQEGPQWVLVSKDGKQRTDVTDVMNTIDKYNRNVDEANNENRMQNQAQSSVDRAAEADKKDNGLQVSETSGKVQIVGDALSNVKDVDGNQVFKPEDIKAVAETALKYSDEKALLEQLKDPKALEEMRKREKKNEREAEDKARARQDKILSSMANDGR